jgi:hypothetical protein
MARKQILDAAIMQEDFFADAVMIGIASAAPAYKLCWTLNQHFDTDFSRDAEHDICLHDKNKQETYFPIFKHAAPFNGSRHVLYSLKSDSKTLLPELKGLDYLWMIRGCDSTLQAGALAEYLRRVSAVQMTALIQPGQLKSLSNLIV